MSKSVAQRETRLLGRRNERYSQENTNSARPTANSLSFTSSSIAASLVSRGKVQSQGRELLAEADGCVEGPSRGHRERKTEVPDVN